MSSIKGYDTQPELTVRSMVHRMGYRFRIRQEQLPGNPDIVLPSHRKVIFIHGCFWHGHKKCKRSRRPSTNEKFWAQKLDKNIVRDKRQHEELRKSGWKVLVIWQCQLRDVAKLQEKIKRFMNK